MLTISFSISLFDCIELWTRLPYAPAGFGLRANHKSVYDQITNTIFSTGGYTSDSVWNDVWAFSTVTSKCFVLNYHSVVYECYDNNGNNHSCVVLLRDVVAIDGLWRLARPLLAHVRH